MGRGEAEDAGGLSPVKDDNEGEIRRFERGWKISRPGIESRLHEGEQLFAGFAASVYRVSPETEIQKEDFV